jgi:hypothetical protein
LVAGATASDIDVATPRFAVLPALDTPQLWPASPVAMPTAGAGSYDAFPAGDIHQGTASWGKHDGSVH